MQNILLAVTGLTPQVITETLYYYTVVARPRAAFDEIRVITTSAGKEKILKELLDPVHGKFHAFCREYGATGIRFDETTIHVIGREKPLDDIRTAHDNGLMANHINKILQQLTEDPSIALYCSIAGGRKTMGAYLALALQLYARPWDRLSHVLVSPEFEACRDFYYPPPEDTVLEGKDADGKTILLHTKDAKIDLAEVPFVRLRRFLPKKKNFVMEEIVRDLQACLDGPASRTNITIDIRKKTLRINGIRVALSPRELALYAFFASARRQCRRKNCPGCQSCFLPMNVFLDDETIENINAVYQRMRHGGPRGGTERLMAGTKAEDRQPYIIQAISKINRKLRQAVGESDYPLAEISTQGGYRDRRYGIRLDRSRIRLV